MVTTTSSSSGHTSATASPTARVAIAGATGYAGQELVRILARHPAVRLTAAMSSAATSTQLGPLAGAKYLPEGAPPAP